MLKNPPGPLLPPEITVLKIDCMMVLKAHIFVKLRFASLFFLARRIGLIGKSFSMKYYVQFYGKKAHPNFSGPLLPVEINFLKIDLLM